MDNIEDLSHRVSRKLRSMGLRVPTQPVVCTLIRSAYLASMRTEEGKFVRGSITFANPEHPELSPPLTRRSDYPGFTRLKPRRPFTIANLVKLSRAIDKWAGSIAVFGSSVKDLKIWGVVDLLVEQNVMLHMESNRGFVNPGLLTISIDGVGDVSAYHGDIFLGGVRQHTVLEKETDALRCFEMFVKGMIAFEPVAQAMTAVLHRDEAEVSARLVDEWFDAIARLCITLRRAGTGGAFLLTPSPRMGMLKVATGFNYRRLSDALILKVLDDQYSSMIAAAAKKQMDSGTVPSALYLEESFAETDADDRTSELRGALKLVASLASLDGVVLLTPDLGVIGFGVKIGNSRGVKTIYDGAGYLRRGKSAKKIDLANFGTRHGSMLRYCAHDRDAIGVVVSQDGHVRLIFSVGKNLLLFDGVKVMNYRDGSKPTLKRRAKFRRTRDRLRPKKKSKAQLGFSLAPKTVKELMTAADSARSQS